MKQKLLVFFAYIILIVPLWAQEEVEYIKSRMVRLSQEEPVEEDEGAFAEGSMMAMSTTASTSTEVGQTPGELTVSATGGATYTVPIAVPPGINGVEPDIALTYNSQGGNGLAGWGWHLSGVSVISRIPSTRFHDGQVAGVDFTATDRFALDGQRLLLKSGSYGKDGAEYETEHYSNMKISSHGISPYGAEYGPAYFKVVHPDGSTALYGHTSGSRSRTEFGITYWENSQGLRVSYGYEDSGNTLRVKTISYGGKGTAAPVNTIEFVYKPRARREQAYIGGQSIIRAHILGEIKVMGNGIGYRNYELSYSTTLLGYQRLRDIREKSGDGSKSYAPLTFTYGYTGSSGTTSSTPKDPQLTVQNISQNTAGVVALDYTGNGRQDFLVYPTAGPDSRKKFWLFTDIQSSHVNFAYEINIGHFKEIFPITMLNHQNKVLFGQSLAVVQERETHKVDFKTYVHSAASPLVYHYTKTWEAPTYNNQYNCDRKEQQQRRVPLEYLSGDFNGDGLSDVIAIDLPHIIRNCYEVLPMPGQPCGISPQTKTGRTSEETPSAPTVQTREEQAASLASVACCQCDSYTSQGAKAYFIDLDRRKTSNFAVLAGSLGFQYDRGSHRIFTADVTGDGKTNIILVMPGKVNVYGLDNNNKLQLLWSREDGRIKKDFPILIGDYNGDGKADFITPTEVGSRRYALFLSTGTGYVKSEPSYPFFYGETNYKDNGSTLYGRQLVSVDINGDGRTDIIDYRTTTYKDGRDGKQEVTIYENKVPGSGDIRPDFAPTPRVTKEGPLKNYPIPVFLSSNRPNSGLDFASISDKWVTSFRFGRDHREEVLLREVNRDGVTEAITYSPLNPYGSEDVYSGAYEEVYPYVDVRVSLGTQVVNKLERSGEGLPTIRQLFSYRGAVAHAEGLGFLGFKRLTRTNWHKDDTDRLYDISFHSPQLRGAVTKSFTSRVPLSEGYDFVKKSLPASHVSLSSATTGTQIATQSITLKPGFSANGSSGTFTARTDQDTGINDGASSTVSHYITRTDYKYSTETRGNKVFVQVPEEVATKDLLHGTHSFKSYNYDSYKNPTREHTNISGQGTRTVTVRYENSIGTPYHIGRPTQKTESRTAYGDTYTTEEHYSYTGPLLTEIKSKGHGTDFMIEAREYDGYGNVIKKTITPPGGDSPRIMEYKYGNTYGGRFLTEITDVEGLSTTYEYNTGTGNVTKETNPYGQATTYSHDVWGKVTKVTDYLGKSVTTTYTKSGTQSTITEIGDDGSSKVSVYDILGQLIRIRQKDVLGQWVEKAIKYDHLGREEEVSEPYIGGVTQWNTTEYDLYGRIKRRTSHTGKATTITYNGLTTTVNDGTKTVTTTKDALGNVTKVTDPGGTINYAYYANGNMKTADYGGSVQRIEQDGWGRKVKLIDPSAGTYTYEYNGFGELLKETTPKGTTTYTYKPDGRLESKKIDGEYTDMQWAYIYNESTKLPTTTTLTNADGNNTTYALTYDATHPQLVRKVVETNPYAVFTRNYTYDSFNRVATEEFIAKNIANSKTSTKRIRNTYQNGTLKNIADFTSQEVLWEISGVNARGQLTEAVLGTTLKQMNTYDQYGFPSRQKTQKITSTGATTEIATLGYDFNPQRGTLNSRSNSMFGWNETFEYDNLDRLTHFNDNNSNNSQSYDSRGRITKNSALGNYAYSGVSYQNTKITVDEEALIPGSTEAARQYYQDHPQQSISYNAFKSPVEIREHGKERISFQYNAAMGRSHMYYGGEESDKTQRRFRKHYSVDGSMEIKEDTETGKTTFVTYIGGDAYSAPLIWHSEQATTTTNNYYYLHRDYLGSILGITDKEGNFKEKRHFDAWGNIVKLTDGAGAALEDFVILDRGYTGHEHLAGVGLVHMNGRLYDPVLHRFLMPDNYVQDPYNTQNFNRYGYVLNNPLMYIDPSGESIESSGETGLWGLAVAAASVIATWGEEIKGARIGRWLRTNLWNPIKRLFGSNKKGKSHSYKHTATKAEGFSYLELGSGWQNEGFGGGVSSLGEYYNGGGGDWFGNLSHKAFAFQAGYMNGFIGGAQSTWNFARGLTTAQGWKDLGHGFMDMAAMGSMVPNVEGMMMRAQLGQSVENYVNNIPNMSAYEVGHDLGFGAEKVAETLLLSKGAGIGVNTIKSGAGVGIGNIRMFSNTTTRGTTLFKTGRNFRIDFDFRNGLHYHRRGPGGIGRHRPWQVKPGDEGNFWKRF